MMCACTGRKARGGFVPLEMLAVIAVIAVLLGLGVMVVKGARHQAHLTQAEGRLKQVSVALDLYFKKFGRYPATGSNLRQELAEFIESGDVFENPLKDEGTPGETVSAMYHQPTLQELDTPEEYLTAMTDDDGKTIVILKTMGKVDTTTRGHFNPDDYVGSKTSAMTVVELEKQEPPPPDSGEETLVELQEGRVVTYFIEKTTKRKTGVSIKFEAEGDQLGEDGTAGTDKFTLAVQGEEDNPVDAETAVQITVKAGTQTFVPPPGVDTLGEMYIPVPLVDSRDKDPANSPPTGWSVRVDPSGDFVYITFDVSADGTQDHALSNIEFRFPDGSIKILEVLPPQRFDQPVAPTY